MMTRWLSYWFYVLLYMSKYLSEADLWVFLFYHFFFFCLVNQNRSLKLHKRCKQILGVWFVRDTEEITPLWSSNLLCIYVDTSPWLPKQFLFFIFRGRISTCRFYCFCVTGLYQLFFSTQPAVPGRATLFHWTGSESAFLFCFCFQTHAAIQSSPFLSFLGRDIQISFLESERSLFSLLDQSFLCPLARPWTSHQSSSYCIFLLL